METQIYTKEWRVPEIINMQVNINIYTHKLPFPQFFSFERKLDVAKITHFGIYYPDGNSDLHKDEKSQK